MHDVPSRDDVITNAIMAVAFVVSRCMLVFSCLHAFLSRTKVRGNDFEVVARCFQNGTYTCLTVA